MRLHLAASRRPQEEVADREGHALGNIRRVVAQLGNVAGEVVPREVGDEVDAGVGPDRALPDRPHQLEQALIAEFGRQLGDLVVDRRLQLAVDQPRGGGRDVGDEAERKRDEDGEVDDRQLERGGADETGRPRRRPRRPVDRNHPIRPRG